MRNICRWNKASKAVTLRNINYFVFRFSSPFTGKAHRTFGAVYNTMYHIDCVTAISSWWCRIYNWELNLPLFSGCSSFLYNDGMRETFQTDSNYNTTCLKKNCSTLKPLNTAIILMLLLLKSCKARNYILSFKRVPPCYMSVSFVLLFCKL